MSLRLQIIVGVIVVLALIVVINMVRTKKIDLRHALSWISLAVIVLILDIFPQILFWIAQLMGIEIPSNMIFLVGLILIIGMVYKLTVMVSKLSEKTKRLTQEVALLREELERMKE